MEKNNELISEMRSLLEDHDFADNLEKFQNIIDKQSDRFEKVYNSIRETDLMKLKIAQDVSEIAQKLYFFRMSFAELENTFYDHSNL